MRVISNGYSRILLYLNVLLVVGSLFPIFISSFKIEREIWSHISSYVLPEAVLNTFWLVAMVSLMTLFLGVVSGWICSQYEFKGRKWISRILIVPLAIPAYVSSFVYLGLFDFTGEWRLWFLKYGWFENFYIHGGWGSCFVLSLSLYPYVYLFSHSAFSSQGRKWQEVAQSLGRSRWSSFLQVEWGFCWPWILSGLALVAMEVVSDFGAVSMFNYDTLSTAIYKIWFDMQSWAGAAQLASLFIVFIFVLMFFSMKFIQKKKYISGANDVYRVRVVRWIQVPIYIFLGGLILLSVIIPVFQLLYWSLRVGMSGSGVFMYGQHSFILGVCGAFLIAFLTLFLSHGLRVNRNVWGLCQQVCYLGYALPGTVLAVGVLGLATFMGWNTGASTFLSLLLILLAYIVRFQPLGMSQFSSAFAHLSNHLDESAILLGRSHFSLLRKVHFPLLKKVVWVSALLIFIDIVKEMPLTLMLRPFGWDTLAVKVFEFTSEGEWERAAHPALIIVLLGLGASWWIQNKVEARGEVGRRTH